MNDHIIRSEIVRREVEIPDGFEVCWRCKGEGMMSKYDEGWRSVMHSAELAAKRECFLCSGRGYIEADR